MADGSLIEWTDATWNVVTGCSLESPGCAGCYAMQLAGTRLRHHPSRAGLTTMTKAGPVWTGEVRFNREWLDLPLRWTRPRRVFVCAHGDLFHEHVPDEWLDQVFAVMAAAPQHTFQVLTKRAARMGAYVRECGQVLGRQSYLRAHVDALLPEGPERERAIRRVSGGPRLWNPLPNLWLGVSVEDQVRADERVPELLDAPAALRFVSAEPLLGPVDLRQVRGPRPGKHMDALLGILRDTPTNYCDGHVGKIGWVIAGGESGPRAREVHEEWVLALRDQCVPAAVPFFFKQWGEFCPTAEFRDGRRYMVRRGKRDAGAELDGREWRQMPA